MAPTRRDFLKQATTLAAIGCVAPTALMPPLAASVVKEEDPKSNLINPSHEYWKKFGPIESSYEYKYDANDFLSNQDKFVNSLDPCRGFIAGRRSRKSYALARIMRNEILTGLEPKNVLLIGGNFMHQSYHSLNHLKDMINDVNYMYVINPRIVLRPEWREINHYIFHVNRESPNIRIQSKIQTGIYENKRLLFNLFYYGSSFTNFDLVCFDELNLCTDNENLEIINSLLKKAKFDENYKGPKIRYTYTV